MSFSARHSRQTIDQGIHAIVAYYFINEADRLAAAGFLNYDLYKLAIQLSDQTFWIITDVAVNGTPTWLNIGSSTGTAVGGDLSGTLPNPSVVDLSISGESQGAVLYYNGTNWVVLSPGTDGYVLTTHSTGQNPSWTAASGAGSGLASTPPVDVTKASAVIGTSILGARADHKHDIATGTPVSIGTLNNEGVSTSLARADHTHAVVDLNIAGQAQGSILYFNGTNWVVLAAGIDGYVLTAKGVAAPIWKQPTASGGGSGPALAAGTQTATSGTVSFINSNGISFGMSNSNQITASYTVPSTAGLISGINVSGGTTSNNLSAIVFSNSNNLSFGLNGSTITGSAFFAQTSLSFSNVNGISFGVAGSTLTASYTVPSVPAQTNQSVGLYALGNTTQNSSTTLDARSLSFNGLGAASVGYSNGSIQVSVPTQTSMSFSNANGVSFGIAGSTLTGSVAAQTSPVFSNSNGISFGTNAGTVTASYTVPTQTQYNFSNSNNISFGVNGSTITATATFAQTVQTQSNIQGISAGTTSQNTGNIVFGNSNGISFGLSAGTITATVVPGAAAGVAAIQAGTQTQTSGTLVFVNSNGLTFGMSGSSQITGSYTVPSTAGLISGINVSAGTTSNNLSAFTLSNSNGLSFGLNGSVITGSYTVPTIPSATVFSNSNNVSFGLNGSTVTATATFAQTAQTQNVVVPSAGTQTATSGTVVFANSNGISFGMSGSNQITASYTVPNVPAQTNQTVGLYALGNTTQNSSTTLDARTLSFNGLGAASVGYSNGSIQISVPAVIAQTSISFSNANNVSFGIAGSTVTASASFAQSAQTQSNIQGFYDGANSISTGTIRVSNANGVSFGINGQTLTASVANQTNQSVGLYAVSNTTGASSSTTADARSLSFQGAGVASVGYSNGSVVISVPSGIANVNVSAGTTSNNLTNFVFSNSNNVSFGLNGSTITATISVPVQTAQTIGLYGLGNTTQNSSTTLDARTLSFNGLGGNTVGYSNGSIQISGVTTAGLISGINLSAGTTSNNLSAITFSNLNGLSFGLNGSVVTGSYTVPTQTNQTEGMYAIGNTAGQSSSSTFDARTMSISGAGNVSVGYSGNALIISGAGGGVANQAGTQTATSGTVIFSNSNGISFGMSNSSVITASYTVPVQTNQSIGLYVLGNTTQNSSTTLDARSLSFNGLGIITAGYSNGSIQISATQSAQTAGFYAVGNTVGQSSSSTFDARTLSFSGAGIASVGYSGNAIVINVPAAGASVNISAGTTSGNLNAVTFANSNGITFGLSNGVITATVTPGAAAGIAAIQGGTQTATSGTLSFANSNGISFGLSNSSIMTASYTVPSTAGLISGINVSAGTTSNNLTAITFSNSNGLTFGLNGSVVTGSYTVPTQTNQTEGFYAVGNTTGQSSSSTFDARTVSFSGAGAASIGYSAGNIIISVPNALTNINVSAGTTSNNLTNFVFSNSNNVSFGLNGSTITATITVPAQTAQSIGLYALGNTTQNSSTTLDARSLSFNGLGGNTVGYSNGSIQISGVTTAGLISGVNISAGTTSNNLTALTFSNSNGLSFGLNGSTITGSYTVPTQTNQTVGLFALGNTTQNSSTTLDARSLSFNGLGAASVGYSNGSVQVSVPVQTVQTQSNIQAIYDGANSISTGTIRYSNANGVSFGINGQTLTGSVAAQTNQTVGLYAISNTTGASSSSTFDARSISFQGAGVASVGYSNGSVVISVPSGIANINVSAGTTSNNLTNFVFSNSNNVSFGLNGSTVTATISVPVQTNQSIGLYALGNTTQNSSTTLDARSLSFNGLGIITAGYSNGSIQISATQSAQTQNVVVPSAGTQTATSGTVIFSNSNGISFGMSNSSIITASYTVPNTAGLISGINVSAGTTSNNLTNFVFSNSNGLSFGLNGSTITGSYTVPVQTNQTEGMYAVGNTTGQSSSSTFDARTMSISGAGNISVGYSGNALIISGAGGGGGIANQAGTQTATSGTVVFSNSNGISFGMSNSSVVTASYTVPSTAGLISGINVSAGTTSNNLTALTFSNSNGLAFGLNGSVVTGSYTIPAQTNQSIGLYALGNTTQNSSTTLDARSLSFNGLGIITAGYSNGSIQISATQSAQTQNIVVPSAGTQSATSGTVIFSNSNGISFGMSNSSIITASYTVPTQSAQSVGVYAIGNTAGQSSSSTFDARTVSFSGAGIASVGYSGNAIVISVPSAAALINISAGTTSNNVGAVTFSNSNGVSFGLNGSTVTASVAAQTNQSVGLYALGNTTQNSSTTLDARSLSFNGLGAVTVGYSNGSIQISAPVQTTAKIFYLHPDSPWQTNFSILNASMSLQHFVPKHQGTLTQANFLMALSGNTNSSGALTISFGAYTMNGSTMSLASSTSRQITWTSGSQTTNSSIYGGISGTCYRTMSLPNWAFSVGDYMLGVWCRTTNNGTWMMFGSQGPTIVNAQDVNETQAYLNGYFSTGSFTTAMVASINLTDTNYVRTGGAVLQQPSFALIGTV